MDEAGVGPDASVLDVGTGKGEELFHAIEKVGPRGVVIGVDLSKEMVRLTAEEIRQRRLENAHVCVTDAEDLALADAYFDFVLSSNVLFLCLRPSRALAEMFRVLRPGGRVAVIPSGGAGGSVGTGTLFIELVREYRSHSPGLQAVQKEREAERAYMRQVGEVELNIESMAEALRRSGFVDVQLRTEEAEFVFRDEDEWWSWQWSHWRRDLLERMEPQVLASFKEEIFARLRSLREPEGIRSRNSTFLALATKPTV